MKKSAQHRVEASEIHVLHSLALLRCLLDMFDTGAIGGREKLDQAHAIVNAALDQVVATQRTLEVGL